MNAETLLLALIRTVICGDTLDKCKISACTPTNLEAVYSLARRHDLAHLAGQALSKLELPQSDILDKCKKAAMSAFLRYTQQDYAFSQVAKAFEDAGIPFIPLKGTVLRKYYPESWYRTSSDMDILVHEADLACATKLLTEKLGYKHCKKTSHDVSFLSPEQVYLELHYSTIEDFISKDAAALMGTVWEKAFPVPGYTCRLQLPDDLFYYYHIAHAAKHLMGGGCGIRVFLDIWVLEKLVPHSRADREALLIQGGMLSFATAAEKLSRIWFEQEAADPMSQLLAQFILSGGTFGNLENRVSINQSRRGGKFKYALSRIFLPYSILQYHYPILQKHKILFPLYQVVRWCKLLFCGGATRSIEELQTNSGVTPEQKQTAAALLNYLQLQ